MEPAKSFLRKKGMTGCRVKQPLLRRKIQARGLKNWHRHLAVSCLSGERKEHSESNYIDAGRQGRSDMFCGCYATARNVSRFSQLDIKNWRMGMNPSLMNDRPRWRRELAPKPKVPDVPGPLINAGASRSCLYLFIYNLIFPVLKSLTDQIR